MRRTRWRSEFGGRGPEPRLRSWLTEAGSLTARCIRHSRSFRVRVLAFGKERPLGDEAARRRAWVREVVLECDGVPVVFAHTTLSTARGGRLTRWLAGLGNRSLGSLLFAYPGFKRGEIEYCRLDARHPLYQRAAAVGLVGPVLWARRSRHRLGQQEVLVTEVFLPAIAVLDQDKAA